MNHNIPKDIADATSEAWKKLNDRHKFAKNVGVPLPASGHTVTIYTHIAGRDGTSICGEKGPVDKTSDCPSCVRIINNLW